MIQITRLQVTCHTHRKNNTEMTFAHQSRNPACERMLLWIQFLPLSELKIFKLAGWNVQILPTCMVSDSLANSAYIY